MIRMAIIAGLVVSLAATAEAQPKDPLRPETFVDVATVAPGILVEARYATAHNFVGARIDGYEKPKCYLTRPAAAALAQVVADLEPRGLTLKAFDCYRPQRAVAHFVRWARNLNDTRMKAEFYPHVEKRDLFSDGYIAARSGHSLSYASPPTRLPLRLASISPGVGNSLELRNRSGFHKLERIRARAH